MPGVYAAHCLFNGSTFTPPTHVLFNGLNIGSFSNFADVIPVSQAFYPSQYKPGVVDSNFDVSVLKLARPTTATTVTLSTAAPPPGTTITSIGWGLTELSASGVKNYLLR